MGDEPLEQVLIRLLRAIASSEGVPLSHVADRAGVARSHLWAVLAGQRSPTLQMVQRLADALDVPPIRLLTDAGEREQARVPGLRVAEPATSYGPSSRAERLPRREESHVRRRSAAPPREHPALAGRAPVPDESHVRPRREAVPQESGAPDATSPPREGSRGRPPRPSVRDDGDAAAVGPLRQEASRARSKRR